MEGSLAGWPSNETMMTTVGVMGGRGGPGQWFWHGQTDKEQDRHDYGLPPSAHEGGKGGREGSVPAVDTRDTERRRRRS